MTERMFAIAACMLERGAMHSRYRAELFFTLADDEDAALGALRSQIAAKRPGWEMVSAAVRAVPEPLSELGGQAPAAEDPPCTS